MSITRINRFLASADNEGNLIGLLESAISTIENSDGCLEVKLLRGCDGPVDIVIIERWTDIDAHKAGTKHVLMDHQLLAIGNRKFISKSMPVDLCVQH